jgi:hypothetical protein
MIYDKTSITGLMMDQHETHRLRNLFYKKIESAYYKPDYGLDWDLWFSDRFEVSTGSFLSYLGQEATKNGIVILDQNAFVQDFSLHVTFKLLSEKITLVN